VDAAEAGAVAIADDSRKGTLVVHVGDSFTEAFFEQNLRGRFAAVGARYWVQAENSSYTTTWAYGDKLDSMLWSKPQLVLINLGANEMEIIEPEKRAPAVRELVKKASKWGTCVWVTPPTWKKDSGYLQVIRDNVAPCALFDSDAHVTDVERRNDHIHPNEVGGAKWAAAFWDWLESHRDPSRGPWALRAD
jgi:lysophospholipase L1-like esterase